MSAWINCADRLPELEHDDFGSESAVVLIRFYGNPYTARLVGANEDLDAAAYWCLMGLSGERAELNEVDQWCEVPA